MIIRLMLYTVLVSALVGAAAIAVDFMLSRLRRPVRGVWILALAMTGALAVSAPFRSQRIVGPNDAAPVATPTALRGTAPSQDRASQTSAEAPVATGAEGSVFARASALTRRTVVWLQRDVPFEMNGWFAFTWIGVSVAALLVMIVVAVRADRARRRWPLTRLHGTDVRMSARAGPVVLGISAPDIVIPQWISERPEPDVRMVLAHEAEHLAARDPQLLTAGSLLVAVMPWNPLAWWMYSRLRLAVELDCDARVLNRGTHRQSYGELLIGVAGRSERMASALALAHRSSHLARRIRAITPLPEPFAVPRAAVAGIAAAFFLALAVLSELPTRQEVAWAAIRATDGDGCNLPLKPGEILLNCGDDWSSFAIETRVTSVAAERSEARIPAATHPAPCCAELAATANRASMPIPVSSLGRTLATAPDTMHVTALRALSDGRVLVSDPGQRRVFLYGADLRRRTVVADSIQSPNTAFFPAGSFGALIPFLGDSTVFIDRTPSAIFPVIGPDGRVARTMTIPGTVPPAAFWSGGRPAFDHAGRLVYRTRARNDSAAVARVDLSTGVTDTLLTLFVQTQRSAAVEGVTGAPGLMRIVQNPVLLSDDWRLLSTGDAVALRVRDYHIYVARRDGSRTSAAPVPFDWRPFPMAERVALLDSLEREDAARIANLRSSASASDRLPDLFVGADQLPDHLPPFRAPATLADEDGNLWVRLQSPPASSLRLIQRTYDVIDGAGRRSARIALPVGAEVVGFGPGVAYVISYVTDRGGLLSRVSIQK